MDSQKRKRFEKVATKRVQNIIGFINLLGNCSNRNNYEYSEEDVAKMFREINLALKNANKSFETQFKKTKKVNFTFTLKD
jgi:hypothetical protein